MMLGCASGRNDEEKGDMNMSKRKKIKNLKSEIKSRKKRIATQETKLKKARKALKKAA